MSINDDFYNEVGRQNYKHLLKAIPDAFESKADGVDCVIGNFLFSKIYKHSTASSVHYTGTATFLGQEAQITFEFGYVERDFFVEIRDLFKVNLNKKTLSKIECTCPSLEFFRFGCQCAAKGKK